MLLELVLYIEREAAGVTDSGYNGGCSGLCIYRESARQTTASAVGEGFDRVDFGGAAGWQVTG